MTTTTSAAVAAAETARQLRTAEEALDVAARCIRKARDLYPDVPARVVFDRVLHNRTELTGYVTMLRICAEAYVHAADEGRASDAA